MSRSLCFMGDNVAGGAQVVRSTASSMADLRADVSRQVRFEPADFNQITYMQFLDPTFNEWVPVANDLAGLQHNTKVHISCEKNAYAPLQAAFLGAALEVFLEKVGRAEASQIRSAITEAMPLLKAGGLAVCKVEGTAAFQNVANLIRQATNTAAAAGGGTSQLTAETLRQQQSGGGRVPSREVTPRIAAADGPQKPAPPGSATKAKALKSSGPTGSSGDAGGGSGDALPGTTVATTASSGPVTFSHLSVMPSVSSAPAVPGSDDITIYCVYSGTTTQRAKAIRASRRAPSLESLLATLRSKFSADLTLGHIDESGTCTEVLSSVELRAVIGTRAAFDSLTLHCWARATVSFDDDASGAGALSVAGGGATRSEAGSSVASLGGGMKRGKHVKSSRPPSANSERASSIAKRKVGKVTPSFPNDTSGVAWTDAQIQELFYAVDVDGSGCLTKQEMMDYYRANHDTMGVIDAEKKFEAFLDGSTEMSDGIITLQEFGVVILKLAQW